ncbi:hypothetical protein T484DRAFT_1771125 [Baffinella frigidus]|nr:hypothetical protein T484DRAFT_1771125 [Cryptophyta sp. CCMP2293]
MQVVVATGKSTLIYLKVGGGTIEEVGKTTTAEEIACLSINPLGAGREKEESSLCVVGLWDKTIRILKLPSLETIRILKLPSLETIRILKLPSLEEVVEEAIGGDVIPRSLLLTTLEGVDYLLCALGDGGLTTSSAPSATGACTLNP